MKSFNVEIKETLAKNIAVKANSLEEAEEKIKKLYKSEDIVLDSDDFDGEVEYDTTEISEKEFEEANWKEYDFID